MFKVLEVDTIQKKKENQIHAVVTHFIGILQQVSIVDWARVWFSIAPRVVEVDVGTECVVPLQGNDEETGTVIRIADQLRAGVQQLFELLLLFRR